jgi:hypothetical protein
MTIIQMNFVLVNVEWNTNWNITGNEMWQQAYRQKLATYGKLF